MIPLIRWSWHRYLRLALIPLLVVEIGLLCAYLITNTVMRDSNIASLRSLADNELTEITQLEARAIDRQLKQIAFGAQRLQQATRQALAQPYKAPESETSRYRFSKGGAWYTATRSDRPAGFYSAITQIGPSQQRKAWQLSQVDPLLIQLVNLSPLIVQSYLNTFDSYNRIYPFFNPIEQYAEKLDIPSYNFYYLADERHNPRRGVTWTEAYVDPAGQGWMTSAIAPVYRGDFLEAVVGVDIRTSDFIEQILAIDIPWNGYILLLDKTGTILAMQPQAEADLGLRELTDYDYQHAILSDTAKPDTFNIYQRSDSQALARVLRTADRGVQPLDLSGPKLAAWAQIPTTGWTLVALVPEAAVYQHANSLNRRFLGVGLSMATAMVVFYALYFLFLYQRARRNSLQIAQPLESIRAGFRAIGQGNYHPALPRSEIEELSGCANDLRLLGEQLERTTQALQRARYEAETARDAQSQLLGRLSHELRTPLNAILGFCQLLELDSLPPAQREKLGHISLAANHLMGLVNALLAATESGSEHEITTVELAPLVADTLQWAASLAREHRIELINECTDSTVTVRAEPVRLRQALFNLVSNAIKYNRAGGSVRISIQQREPHRVRLTVTDTGPGLNHAQQARLFQLFERLDAKQRGITGNGVGLVVARHLIESMGGAIGVLSSPGAGSQFWLELTSP